MGAANYDKSIRMTNGDKEKDQKREISHKFVKNPTTGRYNLVKEEKSEQTEEEEKNYIEQFKAFSELETYNINMLSVDEKQKIFNYFKEIYDNYIASERTILPKKWDEIISDPKLIIKTQKTFRIYSKDAFLRITGSSERAENLYKKFWGAKRPLISIDSYEVIMRQIVSEINRYFKDNSYRPTPLSQIADKYGVDKSTVFAYASDYLTEIKGEQQGKDLYAKIWPQKRLISEEINKIREILLDEIHNYIDEEDYKPISLKKISEITNHSLSSISSIAKGLLEEMYPGKGSEISLYMWPYLAPINKEKSDRLNIAISDEIKKYNENLNYRPIPLNQIADELDISNPTVINYARRVLEEKYGDKSDGVYSQMWPHYERFSPEIYDSIRRQVKSMVYDEITECFNNKNYSPASLRNIAALFDIDKKTVSNYIKSFLKESYPKKAEELYHKLWPTIDFSESELNLIKNRILVEISKYIKYEKYRPTSLRELEKQLKISDMAVKKYAKEILIEKYGEEKAFDIFEKMWPFAERLSIDEIQKIKDIIISEVVNWERNNTYVPTPLYRVARSFSVDITTISRYAIEALNERFGLKSMEIYSKLWLDNYYIWRYIGTKTQLIVNSQLTLYFDTLGIKYFSEPSIYRTKRPDGLILDGFAFSKIIEEERSVELFFNNDIFNKVKALIFDFTFNSSEKNITEKISKYSADYSLLFVVLFDFNKKIVSINKSKQSFILDINSFFGLINLPQEDRNFIRKVLNLAFFGDLSEIMKVDLPSQVRRYNFSDLMTELVRLGLIKEKDRIRVIDYFNN